MFRSRRQYYLLMVLLARKVQIYSICIVGDPAFPQECCLKVTMIPAFKIILPFFAVNPFSMIPFAGKRDRISFPPASTTASRSRSGSTSCLHLRSRNTSRCKQESYLLRLHYLSRPVSWYNLAPPLCPLSMSWHQRCLQAIRSRELIFQFLYRGNILLY